MIINDQTPDILSKKKFTAGLESLFGDFSEDTLEEQQEVAGQEEKKHSRRRPAASEERSASGKDFTSDLQSFLEESFEESLERQLKVSDQKPGRRGAGARRPRPTGLDALIQRTVEESALRTDSPHAGFGKRITLLLDQEKLEKLKEIARQERTFLRNIIDEIVSEYIDAYEQRSKD